MAEKGRGRERKGERFVVSRKKLLKGDGLEVEESLAFIASRCGNVSTICQWLFTPIVFFRMDSFGEEGCLSKEEYVAIVKSRGNFPRLL